MHPFTIRKRKAPPYRAKPSENYLADLVRKGILRRYSRYYRLTDLAYAKGFSREQFQSRKVQA